MEVTLTEDDFRQTDGAELTNEELEKIAGGIRSMDDMTEEMMFLMLKNAEQNANMRRVFEEELSEAVSERAVGGNGS